MSEELFTISVPAGLPPKFRYGRKLTTKTVQQPGGRARSAPTTVTTTKVRELWRPNVAMKDVHGQLRCDLTTLWSSVQGETPWITGSVRGGSPLKNVLLHRHHRYVMTLDLRNAYEQVRHDRLIETISADFAAYKGQLMATTEEWYFIESIIGTYCLRPGGHGLYTGAPTSPMIFNRYAHRFLDEPILVLARRNGFTYTRYLDDLTISSDRPLTAGLRSKLRQIIEAAGFQVSWRKAGVYDLYKLGAIHLNGIGLRANGQTFVPRPYLAKVRRLMHLAQRSGIGPGGELLNDELITGHLAACFYLMPRDQNDWNATDRGFVVEAHAFRRSRGLRPLKLPA